MKHISKYKNGLTSSKRLQQTMCLTSKILRVFEEETVTRVSKTKHDMNDHF